MQRKVPEEALLHSLLPTALVDLQSLHIRRMHAYNEYVVLRKEFRELELERLFKISRQRTLPEFSQCVSKERAVGLLMLLISISKTKSLHSSEEGCSVHRNAAPRGDALGQDDARAARATCRALPEPQGSSASWICGGRTVFDFFFSSFIFFFLFLHPSC